MIKTARQRKGCSTTKFMLSQNEKGQKMKNWKLAVISFVCAINMVIPAQAGTWKQEGETWKYQQDDGTMAANCWIRDDDGSWYYLGQNGNMVRNCVLQMDMLLEEMVLIFLACGKMEIQRWHHGIISSFWAGEWM